jgi:branched-chain amino acid transport system permease protein
MSIQRNIIFVAIGIVGFAIVVACSFYLNNYYLQFGTTLAMFCALALGWNIVGGYMGYPSLATSALFGLGVYVGAIAQVNGMPMFAAWLTAGIVSFILAGLVGAVLLRLKGHYFAIGTVGVVGVLAEIASNWNEVTGGSVGLNLPLFAGDPEFVSRFFFIAMATLAALALLTAFIVDRTRLGFGLRCIRQNESAASMIGLHIFRYKVIAFVLSSVICAFAGAIYASMIAYVDPHDAFNISLSIEIPVVAMIGGLGTVLGPLIGSVAYLFLREIVWANLINWHDAALGILVVLVIYFLPKGVLHISWPKTAARVFYKQEPATAEKRVEL